MLCNVQLHMLHLEMYGDESCQFTYGTERKNVFTKLTKREKQNALMQWGVDGLKAAVDTGEICLASCYKFDYVTLKMYRY